MQDLTKFKLFVDEINQENGRLYKQGILRKYKDDISVRCLLTFAFDPFIIYGLSKKKLSKDLPWVPCTHTAVELLNYLVIHNTGRDQDIQVAQATLRALPSDLEDLLRAIICKDLSIGVDAKTINKEIPGLIREFNVMLANKYFDKPEFVEGKKFAITTKIDGGRIIAMKENGEVSFYTRAGQKYEGLVDLEEEMSRLMPDNTCLDGEITLLNRGTLSSKEAYKQTMKITRADGEKHGVKMRVFDYMNVNEFKNQCCQYPYSTRRAGAELLFYQGNYKFFELLPILYVGEDTSMITTLLDKQVAAGEEGIMINLLDALYEFKRTNSLLKVKKMQTMDLEIIDFEEGEGRLAGTLGAILVRYKDGNVVKVGSGFSDQLRKEIWQNRNSHLGTICEIQYFEETTNANGGASLRFPIFKDFRHDKLEADF